MKDSGIAVFATGFATSETSLSLDGCFGVYLVASFIFRSRDWSWWPFKADFGAGVLDLTGSFGPGAA